MGYQTIDDIYQAVDLEETISIFVNIALAQIDTDLNKCSTIEEFLMTVREKADKGNPLYCIITGEIYHGDAYRWYTGSEHVVENSKFLYDRDLAIQYYQNAVDLGSRFACSRLGDLFSGYAL